MKKIIVLIAAVILCCGTAMAQRQGGRGQQMTQEDMARMRTENIKRQAESLAKDMKLDKDKSAEFITDYTAYQEELQGSTTFDMSAMTRGRQEQKKVKDMSDDECYEEITNVLKRQEEQAKQAQTRLDVTKKWLGTFMEKGYTAQQLYQIFAEQRRAGGQGGFGGQGGARGGMGGFGGGMPAGGMGGFGGGMPGGGFGGGF